MVVLRRSHGGGGTAQVHAGADHGDSAQVLPQRQPRQAPGAQRPGSQLPHQVRPPPCPPPPTQPHPAGRGSQRLALSLNELESGATQAPPPRARLAQTLRVPLITISVFLPHALSPFSLTAVPHSVAAFFPTRQVRHGELRGPQLQRGHARVLHPRYARREPRAVSWVLESPGPSTTRPHRLSHCVSLTITTPTVSPSPSPSLRRLSHCVSLTITTPTVSPSPSPSLRRARAPTRPQGTTTTLRARTTWRPWTSWPRATWSTTLARRYAPPSTGSVREGERGGN